MIFTKELLQSLTSTSDNYYNYYLEIPADIYAKAYEYLYSIVPDNYFLEKELETEFNIKINNSNDNVIITGDIRDLYEFYDTHYLEKYADVKLIDKLTNKNLLDESSNNNQIIENNSGLKTSTLEFLIKDEEEAVKGYENAIQEARESNDETSIPILQHILEEELEHIQELKDLATNNSTTLNK